MEKPFINQAKCTNCKTCIKVCPKGVFGETEGKVFVEKPEECIACKACELNCPKEAIEVKPF